jgi:hypothetical protein
MMRCRRKTRSLCRERSIRVDARAQLLTSLLEHLWR